MLPAQQILADEELYVQQVKVNAKEAFTGEQWQWHYDFATHHGEDGAPEPLALNLHSCGSRPAATRRMEAQRPTGIASPLPARPTG